jgi:hypothetical protein
MRKQFLIAVGCIVTTLASASGDMALKNTKNGSLPRSPRKAAGQSF